MSDIVNLSTQLISSIKILAVNVFTMQESIKTPCSGTFQLSKTAQIEPSLQF